MPDADHTAAALPDGTYEVIVVDADAAEDPAGALRVEVSIIAGPRKGEVVALVAAGLGRDPLDLLAAPGTVEVADGLPHLTLDG